MALPKNKKVSEYNQDELNEYCQMLFDKSGKPATRGPCKNWSGGASKTPKTFISEIDTSLDNHEEQLVCSIESFTGKTVKDFKFREAKDAGSGYYLEAYDIVYEDNLDINEDLCSNIAIEASEFLESEKVNSEDFENYNRYMKYLSELIEAFYQEPNLNQNEIDFIADGYRSLAVELGYCSEKDWEDYYNHVPMSGRVSPREAKLKALEEKLEWKGDPGECLEVILHRSGFSNIQEAKRKTHRSEQITFKQAVQDTEEFCEAEKDGVVYSIARRKEVWFHKKADGSEFVEIPKIRVKVEKV